MKEQLPKQVYTNEFREQAVLLVTRDGLSIALSRAPLVNVFEDIGQLGQARQRWAASGDEQRWQCRSARGHRSPSRVDQACAARLPSCGWSATS